MRYWRQDGRGVPLGYLGGGRRAMPCHSDLSWALAIPIEGVHVFAGWVPM